MKRAALILAALVAACAAPRTIRVPTAAGSCEIVEGACVLYAVDARDRVDVHRAAIVAARYWGTPPTALAGWTIVVHGRDPIGGTAWGLTLGSIRRVDFTVQFPDCPAAVLVHEWGHAADIVVGGAGRPHRSRGDDPRFDDALIFRALGCP